MNNVQNPHQNPNMSRKISIKQHISSTSPQITSMSSIHQIGGVPGHDPSLLSLGSPPKQVLIPRDSSGVILNLRRGGKGSEFEALVTESDTGMNYVTSNNDLDGNVQQSPNMMSDSTMQGSNILSEHSQKNINPMNASSPSKGKRNQINGLSLNSQHVQQQQQTQSGQGNYLVDKRGKQSDQKHNSIDGIGVTGQQQQQQQQQSQGQQRSYFEIKSGQQSDLMKARTMADAKSMRLSNIPDWISEKKSSLIELNLSYNIFLSVPLEICQFLHLRLLRMDFNQIVSIPEDIAFLKNLEDLSISHNRLQLLPHTLQNMQQLRILNVSHNSLTQISSEITGLIRLEALYLQNNLFTQLPIKLYRLNNLKELGLDWFKYVRPALNEVIVFPAQANYFKRMFDLCYSKMNVKLESKSIQTGKEDFISLREFLHALSDDIIDLRRLIFQANSSEDIGVLIGLTSESQDLLNFIDSFGHTVLTSALLNNKYKCVQALLEAGADPRKGGGSFGSALHLAVTKLSVDLVSLFLELGSNPNTIDVEGNTPLHLIFSIFSKDPHPAAIIIEILLQFGANPNSLNNELWSPLHLAVRKNQRLAIQYAILQNEKKKENENKKDQLNEGSEIQLCLISNDDEDDNDDDNDDVDDMDDNIIGDENERGGRGQRAHKKEEDRVMIHQKDKQEGGQGQNGIKDLRKQASLVSRQKSYNPSSYTAATISGLNLDENQKEQAEGALNGFFDFDLEGGANRWTSMHLAACQGNIPMIEILSEANSSPFALTRFSQTPRRIALQSLILFKILRKQESRWVERNILEQSDSKSLRKAQIVSSKNSPHSREDRNINNLRDFIAESMKQKEHFLQELSGFETVMNHCFEEKEFGYSMKANLQNNQAEQPRNKVISRNNSNNNDDDDEIEDPEASQSNKVTEAKAAAAAAAAGSQCGSSLATGTLKPQQITTKLSGKDNLFDYESEEMSGIDEGFDDESKYVNEILDEETIKVKVIQNDSNSRQPWTSSSNSKSNHCYGSRGDSNTVAAAAGGATGANEQFLSVKGGVMINGSNQQKEKESYKMIDFEDELEEQEEIERGGELFNEIHSLGDVQCGEELERLVKRFLNPSTSMSSCLGLLTVARILHMRLTSRELFFRCEKGTLPRYIHMFNEFLFSKLSAEEISKQIDAIPIILASLLDTLFSRILPLPSSEDLSAISSMTVYMQHNTVAILNRANQRVWQLIFSIRDTLFGLNKYMYLDSFIQKCDSSFNSRNKSLNSTPTASQGNVKQQGGFTALSVPQEKQTNQQNEKEKQIKDQVVTFSTCDFSLQTLIDFENLQNIGYQNIVYKSNQISGSASPINSNSNNLQSFQQTRSGISQHSYSQSQTNQQQLLYIQTQRTQQTSSSLQTSKKGHVEKGVQLVQPKGLDHSAGLLPIRNFSSENNKTTIQQQQQQQFVPKGNQLGIQNPRIDQQANNLQSSIGQAAKPSVGQRNGLRSTITGEENISDDEDANQILNNKAAIKCTRVEFSSFQRRP